MKKRIFIGSIIIVVLSCLLYTCYLFVYKNSSKLKIELVGKSVIKLNYSEKYEDEGAKASYDGKKIDVKTTSNVNYDKLGSYTISYSVNYSGMSKKIIRKINIVDNKEPEIKLNDEDSIILNIGKEYEEPGFVAIDNYDGDITSKVSVSNNIDVNNLGDYEVVYSVSDSSGNKNEVTRKVSVVPKPVINNQGIAVLNYHFFYQDVSEGCDQIICTQMDNFREQLQYLNDNGYKTLTMKEFVAWMYGEIDLPKKSVLLTIDDGWLGTSKINGNHLIPALEEYKIHASIFLITGDWDIENYRSDYLEVYSHTHNLHREQYCGHGRSKVNCVSYDELVSDLKTSNEETGNNLAFAFPYYEFTNTSMKAIKDVGFKVSFLGGDKKATRYNDKWMIPRYVMLIDTNMDDFKNMIS